MQTGAVIVAAGMSSRMGDFKPMLNIGSISIAQRIVSTLQQAGVTKIVMITGHNATELERHLSNNGIVFLRNEDYQTTQMFDSAKIGLGYLMDKCSRILFTPVDVPLFTAETVTALLKSEAPLACPVCDGERGHPILLSREVVENILQFHGDGGLKAAVDSCGTEMTEVYVNDPGILQDADTPEDYNKLLAYHNQQLVRPVVQVALARERVFFDGRMSMLLHLVDETKSVRLACERMQISYSTGWTLVRKLESQLSYKLIERSQGGAGGSKSDLTADGRRLLRLYEDYTAQVQKAAKELYERYFHGVL